MQNMIDVKEVLLLWFKNVLIKNYRWSNGAIKNKVKQNNQLTEEWQKLIIKIFKRRKAYPSFKDNIQGVNLVDIQLMSEFNKEIKFLLCVIDIFSKYAGLSL